MKTGLRKQLPQKRRIQRPSGEQDLTVGAAPKFGKRTVIQGIINVESISSHSYIKEASEGHGLSIWRMPNRGFALAIDKIYLREGGNLQTIQDVSAPYAGNWINLKQNQLTVVRTSTDGEGYAIDVYPRGSNSDGVGCVTEDGSSGNAIYGMAHDGYAIYGAISGDGIGRAGHFDGLVECTQDVLVGTNDASAGSLYIRESTAAHSNIVNFGQLWTKNNSGTGELWFTDPAGTDTKIV